MQESGKAIYEWLNDGGSIEESITADKGGEAEEGEEAEVEEKQNEEEAAEIKTKSDLYKIYKGKGPHKIFVDLIMNDQLRDRAVIIEGVARPLEYGINYDLEQQRKGHSHWVSYAVNRCVGGLDSWWNSTVQTMAMRHDPKFLIDRLRLSGPCVPPLSVEEPFLQSEVAKMNLVCDFSDALSARHVWSNMFFSWTLPHGAAFMASPDADVRKQHMQNHFAPMIKALLAAHDAYLGGNLRVSAALQSIGWDDEALPIEILALFVQSGFDPDNQAIRSIMNIYLRGNASDMDILEKCFAHLSDIASRHSKNKKLAFHALWLYATTSPYVVTSALKQSIPTCAQWFQYACLFAKSTFSSMFVNGQNLNHFKLPEVLPQTSGRIQASKFRCSGPLGHHTSCASMAYILHDQPTEWTNHNRVWASCLLARGGIFEDNANPLLARKPIYLSFGFTKFAALACTLQQLTDGSDEYLQVSPASQTTPKFIMNFDVSNTSRWQRVNVQPLPPSCVPEQFASDVGSIYKVTSREWALTAGIREGLYLTISQLKQICGSIGAGLPKTGSDNKNSVVKIDIAYHLVKFLFTSASSPEIEDMVRGIMKYRKNAVVDLDVLASVASLDPENAESFKPMVEEAIREFASMTFAKGKRTGQKTIEELTKQKLDAEAKMKQMENDKASEASAENVKQWGLTPPGLKLLLPGGGEIANVFYAQFHGIHEYYRVAYPDAGHWPTQHKVPLSNLVSCVRLWNLLNYK